jgi:hypothetical protein
MGFADIRTQEIWTLLPPLVPSLNALGEDFKMVLICHTVSFPGASSSSVLQV